MRLRFSDRNEGKPYRRSTRSIGLVAILPKRLVSRRTELSLEACGNHLENLASKLISPVVCTGGSWFAVTPSANSRMLGRFRENSQLRQQFIGMIK